MAFLSADQTGLFLPLLEGMRENPPFSSFLQVLTERTDASRALLAIRLASATPAQPPIVTRAAASRATSEAALDFAALGGLGLHPFALLRPGRVYDLDEMLAYGDPARLARQRQTLGAMNIGSARWLRVSVGGVADAWVILVRERQDFAAAAVATLSGVTSPLEAALRTLAALGEQRLQAVMAQDALARLGVAQLAFDATGRVMAADPGAEAILNVLSDPGAVPGRRLKLPPDVAGALNVACAELAMAATDGTRVVRLDERTGLDLLLRRAVLALDETSARPAVIGTLRRSQREGARAAERTLAAVHGLSDNEAALALALSRGETIRDAARRLGLTEETARNYSKRIYAKTGTTGQADLVRLILTGLAPFA